MTHFVARRVAKEVECMPDKCEVMNAQPITTKTNKQKRKRKTNGTPHGMAKTS
jgi:hypothetical protein